MQLSNFWRDIWQDWVRGGRIYIPQEDLDRFGYSEADLAARRINQNLSDLMEFEIERTEGYYRSARASIRMLADGHWGVICGLEVYRRIIVEIRRNRYDVFSRRAGAGTAQLARLVMCSWVQTRLPANSGA